MSLQVVRNAEPRPQQQNTTSGLWVVLLLAVVFGLILAAFSGGKDKTNKEPAPLTQPQVKVEPVQATKVEPIKVSPEPIKQSVPMTTQGNKAVDDNGNNNSVHVGDVVHNHITNNTIVVVEGEKKTVTTPTVTTTPQSVKVAPNPYCEEQRKQHDARVVGWKKALGAQ